MRGAGIQVGGEIVGLREVGSGHAYFTLRDAAILSLVVITDEAPGDYWYLPPMFIALAVLAALFAWALVMVVRRQFFDDPTVSARR